jgi:hypothetical protein
MDTRVQIRKGGRLVVPLQHDSIRLIPMLQAVGQAQKAVKRYVPKGVSLVDELIKARQEEAHDE